MQFNSYIFILLFLPIILFGYFTFNKINLFAGKCFLIIGSAVFYAYGGWKFAAILGGSILINYIFSFAIYRMKRKARVVLTGIAIMINVALLFYFKYFNFFIVNANSVLGTRFTLREIVLPLGMSFFTFQQIMYIVNVYRQNVAINFIDYLAYVLYFPKILMGPLADPVDLIRQLNDKELKHINWDHVSYGIKIFSFGLFKKMVLADTFAGAVTWGYTNIDLSTSMDWFLIMLFYTFEIYFDFSGYSDMAVGVSKMLNIDLPVNFDSPYKALSIRDFWKRWHMSLTGFLTKYIYIPLGGSKKGKIRTYLNTMIVFLVSGIWHGANWTFILWGTLHGGLSVLDRISEKSEKKLMKVVRWAGTFFAINMLWLLFRSDSIGQWWNLVTKMFSFQDLAVSDGLIYSFFVLPETAFMIELNTIVRGFNLLLFITGAFFVSLVPENNYRKLEENNWLTLIMASVAFVWSFLCLSRESIFVYLNF